MLLCAAFTAHAQDVLVEDYRFGDFQSAHSVAVDQFGHVYISDAGNALLRKFTLKGELLAEMGGPGWSTGQFDQLRGIDASLGIAIYAADRGNRRIVRLDRDLNVVGSLSGETLTDGFGFPVDVTASSFETLYILDSENSRVVAVNGFTSVQLTFGGIEAGPGRLREPLAMAQGAGDRLYVLESGRVVVFDLFGGYRFQFGEQILHEARGIAATSERVAVVTTTALHLFSAAGELLATYDRERFVLAGIGQEFRDVAFSPGFLLLLTHRSCIIIPVN